MEVDIPVPPRKVGKAPEGPATSGLSETKPVLPVRRSVQGLFCLVQEYTLTQSCDNEHNNPEGLQTTTTRDQLSGNLSHLPSFTLNQTSKSGSLMQTFSTSIKDMESQW